MGTNTNLIDKSGWPWGPWMEEPDRKEWRWEGFPCLIQRCQSTGALWALVGIPEGHPWHGKFESEMRHVTAHQGLGYFGYVYDDPFCQQYKGFWWVGFECSSPSDYTPGMRAALARLTARTGWRVPPFKEPPIENYKDLHYVRVETEALVMQAVRAAT